MKEMNKIEEICLWVLLITFSLIMIIAFADIIGYLVLAAGVLIPALLLLNKNKK